MGTFVLLLDGMRLSVQDSRRAKIERASCPRGFMSGEISVKNSVEYLSETHAKLDIAVSAAEFQPAYQKAAKQLAKKVNIPGFRPGKAPLRVLEANIGRGYLIEEAINENLDSYYQSAAEEFGIKPMARPEVSINQVPEMSGAADDKSELNFTVEVDIRPEISLPDPREIKIEVTAGAAGEEDIEAALTDLRKRFATLSNAERPAVDGDYLNIDLVAKLGEEEVDDMQGVSYLLGSENMLEGQDEALQGAKAGDVVTFTSTLAGGEHAGAEAEVSITVNSVKESVLPDVDDDFAQLASEFDTVAELREDLEKSATKQKKTEAVIAAQQKLIDELMAKADFPLPESVVEEELNHQLQNEGKEDDAERKAELLPEIEKQLRLQLLLDEYAIGFDITVEQNELLNFLVQQAQMYGMDPNQFIQAAAQSNQINAFAGEMARNKAIISALRLAQVVDESGAAVDLDEVFGEAPEAEKLPEFSKKPSRKITPAKDTAKKPAAKKADAKKDAAKKPVAKKAPAKEKASADKAKAPKKAAVEAPAKSALKADWIAYRVAKGDLGEAEAKKLTKEQLINFGA